MSDGRFGYLSIEGQEIVSPFSQEVLEACPSSLAGQVIYGQQPTLQALRLLPGGDMLPLQAGQTALLSDEAVVFLVRRSSDYELRLGFEQYALQAGKKVLDVCRPEQRSDWAPESIAAAISVHPSGALVA